MKKVIIAILGLLLFIGIYAISYYRNSLDAKLLPNPNYIFSIASGESVEKIAANLVKAGLIRSATCFKIYVWLNKKDKSMQAGEYEIKKAMDIPGLVTLFSSGETISRERTVKIIEGWTREDIDDYFAGLGISKPQEFLDITDHLSPWPLAITKPDFLNDAPGQASLEGFLFPDTYRVFRDATKEEIIGKILANFAVKLDPALQSEIKRQKKTVFEVVTLASIVEKEVQTPADMKIAAGVFWQRLASGQALGSDATLSYILGENKAQHSLEETKTDSPYNTYKYPGLPPGPIANPGLNAILAAIYPQSTAYNYFLTRPDTGATVFSQTYEEHLRNKAKYLH